MSKRSYHVRRGPSSARLSRRQFLCTLGAAAAGLLVGGCASQSTVAPARIAPSAPAAAVPTVVVPSGAPAVAIAKAASYDRKLVRQQIQTLLDQVGGAKQARGARVAIKINLTGGAGYRLPAGVTAVESYATHPEVVRALGEALRDAGAKELFIVEAIYDQQSFRDWGYAAIARDLGAQLIDLNSPAPYQDFTTLPVGEGWFIYKEFTANRLLQETDLFVSVAKMKCHYSCGVTLAMKNLVGMVPSAPYRLQPNHNWRSAFHGEGDSVTGTRLPRVVVDLNRARPIHLAVLDGIKTGEGGELPRGNFAPVAPGVLLAGTNPVATDTVATMVMGFDPTIEAPNAPFLRADNYFNLAQKFNLGTNRIKDIQVLGNSIDSVRYPFAPARTMD
jgi:uncharacterized protein (DUF362 family)